MVVIGPHVVHRLQHLDVKVRHVQRGELELGRAPVGHRDRIGVDIGHGEAHNPHVVLKRRIDVRDDHADVVDPGPGQFTGLQRRVTVDIDGSRRDGSD